MPLENEAGANSAANESVSAVSVVPTGNSADRPTIRESIERSFAERAASTGDEPPKTPAKSVVSDAPPQATSDKQPATSEKDSDTGKNSDRLSAPVKWTKEEKEAWEKMTDGLAPEAVAAVEKIKGILLGRNKSMEGEFTRQMQSIASDRSWKSEIDKILEPRRQQWKAAGITDAAALDQLLAGFDYSMRDLPGFINWICAQRGTTLQALFPQSAAAPAGRQHQQQPNTETDDGVKLHPAVQRLIEQRNDEIEQLKGQLQQVVQRFGSTEQSVMQFQQAQAQAQASSVSGEIAAFEQAKDESGAPKYPLFNDVRADMGRLMEAGFASDLASAYEAAVYARPDLRTKVIESRDIQIKRDYERRMQDEAKKARAAGGGIPPSGSSVHAAPVPKPKGGSIREAIEAAAMVHLGGASRI